MAVAEAQEPTGVRGLALVFVQDMTDAGERASSDEEDGSADNQLNTDAGEPDAVAALEQPRAVFQPDWSRFGALPLPLAAHCVSHT